MLIATQFSLFHCSLPIFFSCFPFPFSLLHSSKKKKASVFFFFASVVIELRLAVLPAFLFLLFFSFSLSRLPLVKAGAAKAGEVASSGQPIVGFYGLQIEAIPKGLHNGC